MTAPQIQANRANAQLSTGPRSEPGKRRSSFNAFKHGLCGKVHIATPEESAAFTRHCNAYRESLAPVGPVESDLVQSIAEDRWRLKRARTIENNIFAAGINEHADEIESGDLEIDNALAEGKTWLEQSKFLTLITLYERRIHRAIEKNTAQLRAEQATRKAAYAAAEREAILLSQHAASKGETYESASDFLPARQYGGFVYSPSGIGRMADRQRRLAEAVAHQNRSAGLRSRQSSPLSAGRRAA